VFGFGYAADVNRPVCIGIDANVVVSGAQLCLKPWFSGVSSRATRTGSLALPRPTRTRRFCCLALAVRPFLVTLAQAVRECARLTRCRQELDHLGGV
jgi:hypothetical protein